MEIESDIDVSYSKDPCILYFFFLPENKTKIQIKAFFFFFAAKTASLVINCATFVGAKVEICAEPMLFEHSGR